MLRTEQLIKKYRTASGDVVATDHVNLHFSCNGLYVILGKSGCGKTTLLNILSGLDSHDEGHIYVDGIDISSYQETQLDEYRNLQMGVIFQEFNLISELTVSDNLRMVLEIQEWDGKSEDEIQNRIETTLTKVGLTGYGSRYINQLSGGERQRVAIARTLVKQPNIIFADEPTGNLDSKNSSVIFELLSEIAKEYVVIVVTHDRESALRYGTTIIEMENGHVSEIKQQNIANRNATYTLTCQKNREQPQNMAMSTLELSSFLVELITRADTQDRICLTSIQKQEPQENEQTNTANCIGNKVSKKTHKLPSKYRLRLSASFLAKKKLTLCLTICILAISLALFFGALTTSFYQRDKTILAYMNTYHPEVYPVFVTKSYQDSFYQTHTETIAKGKYFSDLLATFQSDEMVQLKAIYDNDIYTVTEDESYSDYAPGVTMFFLPDHYTQLTLAEGNYPNQNNECLVTDYLASELGIALGDRITNLQQELKVCGIVQTDYIEYQLKAKLAYGSSGPFVDYYLQYRYNVVYCKTELLHNDMPQSNQRLLLPMSDFTVANRERSYQESKLYYDTAQKVTASNLCAGRMPQADNEVLVSECFFEEHGLSDSMSQFQMFSGEFVNLNQLLYRNSLSNILDLSAFFPDGVLVVGVVSTLESESLDADVFVSQNIWSEISESYYHYYAAEILYHVNETKYPDFLQGLSANQIRIEEPSISLIYGFSDTIYNMRGLLYALLVITILLSGFMLTNFIQISMRSNKRNIGILRALGIPMNEVVHMFTIESWFVYLCSVLLAIPIIQTIQTIANRMYMKNLTENPFHIISWNWSASLIVFFSGTLISILTLRITLKKLKKQKPIELIREAY